MNTPYLIQRATFEDREYKTGIDSVIHLDYMGSSEFEWGAIPDSLKRIRENAESYIHFQYFFQSVPNKSVIVFCKKEDAEQLPFILEKFAKNEIRCKEYVDLDTWIKNDSFCKNHTDFWWDIDNDIMFWKVGKVDNQKLIDKIKVKS